MGKTDKMTENGPITRDKTDDYPTDDLQERSKLEGSDTNDMAEISFDGSSFQELFEESEKTIDEGKVVTGEIVHVDKEYILVDIGYKSEGQIRTAEFMGPDGRLTAQVGDKVDVLLVRKEDKEGRIILSKKMAAMVKRWDEVENIYRTKGTIRGKIVSLVKGGLSVDVGLQAFLPGSQADIRPVRDLGVLVGTEHDFRVLKFEKDQKNIVLSRRAALEAERTEIRKKTLENLEKDAILEGIVSNITRFGLFVDLGGIDGLVHITDISWGKVGNPSEIYRIGDKIKVKLLNYDEERERISLGIKQLSSDPWQGAQDKYPLGTVTTGRVTRLKEFGAFVELEEGIEGLIHISQIPKGKQEKLTERFSLGDEVKAEVVNVSIDDKRIGLSIRKMEERSERDLQKGLTSKRKKVTSNIGEILIEKMTNSQSEASPDKPESENIEAKESDVPDEPADDSSENPSS